MDMRETKIEKPKNSNKQTNRDSEIKKTRKYILTHQTKTEKYKAERWMIKVIYRQLNRSRQT